LKGDDRAGRLFAVATEFDVCVDADILFEDAAP
jgi:hypothetical protein